jgi:putative ABC transport system permease protein
MNLFEAIGVAWIALTSYKLRAFLTMLGIIIGVGAVIGIMAIGTGYMQFMQAEFDKLGVGVFTIRPDVDSGKTDETLKPRLTAEDAEAIMLSGDASAIETVVSEYTGNGIVTAGGERYYFGIKGVTPNGFTITQNEVGAGRFYNSDDEASQARIAVLGQNVAETLFGTMEDALNKRVSVNGLIFEVIGVCVAKTSSVGGGRFNNPNDLVYIPYHTARARLFRNRVTTRVNVSTLTVKARSKDEVAEAVNQVGALLRDRHRLTYQSNDFTIQSSEENAKTMESTLMGFNAFLTIVAGISLLVGGIGIMNIMLVSVAQRTREIGLRKAVGARRRDILMQFLVEALVLCLFGGSLGIALGYSLSSGGTFVLEEVFGAKGAKAMVTLDSVILATVVSASIGLVFGFFPALKAARLHPIQALRYE